MTSLFMFVTGFAWHHASVPGPKHLQSLGSQHPVFALLVHGTVFQGRFRIVVCQRLRKGCNIQRFSRVGLLILVKIYNDHPDNRSNLKVATSIWGGERLASFCHEAKFCLFKGCPKSSKSWIAVFRDSPSKETPKKLLCSYVSYRLYPIIL